jgi:type IV pilus assembly protein PilW
MSRSPNTMTLRPLKNLSQRPHVQAGLSLMELLIAMSLGMGITAAAIALLLTAKTSADSIHDVSHLDDNAQFALEVITRALHQTNAMPWDTLTGKIQQDAPIAPAILGLDNHQLLSTTPALQTPITPGIHGSDVLALRYTPPLTKTQQTLSLACGLAEQTSNIPTPQHATIDQRGWQIFYLANNDQGQSELRCKYDHLGQWQAITLVTGVLTFQVLYGIRLLGQDHPQQFLTATQLHALDQQRQATGRKSLIQPSVWEQVIALKIAFILEGEQVLAQPTLDVIHLFGKAYSESSSSHDHIVFDPHALTIPSQQRRRQLIQTTIALRLVSSDEGSD